MRLFKKSKKNNTINFISHKELNNKSEESVGGYIFKPTKPINTKPIYPSRKSLKLYEKRVSKFTHI